MHIKPTLILLIAICFSQSACTRAVGHNYVHVQTEYPQNTDAITAIALKQLGKPYKFGGNGPSSYDCSGLVYYAYKKAGITVPRSSRQQLKRATKIPVRSLKPGDLVFFSISNNKISHVGIYLGNNRFIHSPSNGKNVQIVNLDNPYWQRHFVTAARIYK